MNTPSINNVPSVQIRKHTHIHILSHISQFSGLAFLLSQQQKDKDSAFFHKQTFPGRHLCLFRKPITTCELPTSASVTVWFCVCVFCVTRWWPSWKTGTGRRQSLRRLGCSSSSKSRTRTKFILEAVSQLKVWSLIWKVPFPRIVAWRGGGCGKEILSPFSGTYKPTWWSKEAGNCGPLPWKLGLSHAFEQGV